MRAIIIFLFVTVVPQTFAQVRIGGAFGLNGVTAPFGKAELNGATLALAEWNAAGSQPKVEMVVEDVGSTQAQSVTAIQKLINQDGLKIIVGPTWLDTFQGVIPIAARKGVLLLTPSAATRALKKSNDDMPLVYSTWYSTEQEVDAILQLMSEDGAREVAAVFDHDPYFQLIRQVFMERVQGSGIVFVDVENFNINETDFRAWFARIRQRRPHALLFMQQSEASVLSFFKQRAESVPDLPVYALHDFEGFTRSAEIGPKLKNITYTVPKIQDQEFATKYRNRFKEDPILSASNSYDAVRMLTHCFSKGSTTPTEVAACLSDTEFDTSTFGSIQFDKREGVNVSSYEVRRVK